MAAVIDPPVTQDERLADAIAAFGLLCDRAIEYLDVSEGKEQDENRLPWFESAQKEGTNER